MATAVNLAAHVQIGVSVFLGHHGGCVDVVAEGVVPHGLHGVQIETQHVAVVVAGEAVVAVRGHRRFYARRGASHGVAQGGVRTQFAAVDGILIYNAVFAGTEQELTYAQR